MLGRAAQERLIYVDDFFRFVIEEIDLRAHYTQTFKQREEFFASLRRAQAATVLPKPEFDILLVRVIDQVADLRFSPTLPDSFDHVVFKAELTGEPRTLSYSFETILAAIEITPNGASRLYPISP